MTRLLYADMADSQRIERQLALWLSEFPQSSVLAMVAEQDKDGVPALQALFREASVPLVGAVFPEIHLDGRFYRQGVLLVLMNPPSGFYRMVEFSPQEGQVMAQVAQLASDIQGELREDQPTTLFMLFDALVPNIGSILEALYLQLAESVHYAGANAGSETFQPMPCLFDHERCIANGLLAILLKPHEGAVLEHSYQVPDELIAATSTEGNRIISIGWQPAFQVYQERIKGLYGIEINQENFYHYAVHFPFGILRADDEVLVRIPVALAEDGSLFCVGEVPEHAVLTLLEAPPVDRLHSTDLLAERMSGRMAPGLNFYCAGRRLHLGAEAAATELKQLQSALGVSQLFGALSLGEIGSSQRGGYPLFHNATLVCMEI